MVNNDDIPFLPRCAYTGKVHHLSRKLAAEALRNHVVRAHARSSRTVGLYVYHCSACDGFHIGSAKPDLSPDQQRRRPYRRTQLPDPEDDDAAD